MRLPSPPAPPSSPSTPPLHYSPRPLRLRGSHEGARNDEAMDDTEEATSTREWAQGGIFDLGRAQY